MSTHTSTRNPVRSDVPTTADPESTAAVTAPPPPAAGRSPASAPRSPASAPSWPAAWSTRSTTRSFALWFLQRFTAFLPISVAVLLLIYPTGRFLSGRWGVLGRLSLGLMCTAAAFFVVAPSAALSSWSATPPPGVDFDPTTLWVLAPVAATLRSVLLTLALTAFVVPVLSVGVRYRRSVGVDRDRMRWLLWGVIAMVLVVAVTGVLDIGQANALGPFLIGSLPALATTVAIVNPSLVPIEDLLARTLVYGGLSLTLVLVDLAVLSGLTRLLGDSLDQRQVVLVVLVLRDRAAPYDVVAGLASTLESAGEGYGRA